MTSINMNPGKYPAACLGAACVTVCLFYLMQLLISSDVARPITEPIKIQPVTLEIPVTKVIHSDPKPKRPEEAPLIERVQTTVIDSQSFGHVSVVIAPPDKMPLLVDQGFSLNEGSALVLRQVNPVYPGRALNQGIEGYVLVEFDINPAGMVIDPRVVFAEPENVFDRAALNAISRWRFKPKVEKGAEVFQYNEQRRISFTIEK